MYSMNTVDQFKQALSPRNDLWMDGGSYISGKEHNGKLKFCMLTHLAQIDSEHNM